MIKLKAYLPIIALCAVTFAVSFAGGLWWEMSQQEEWGTSESSGKDVNQSIAKRRTDKEKTKSEKESQTDTKQEKVAADEKDKPAKPEKTVEGSETRPVEVTPEAGAVPNVSPTAVPSHAIRVPGGMKRLDMSTMSEEQRAQIAEAMRTAHEAAASGSGRIISSVEISSESESTFIIRGEEPSDGEAIIVEPDN